MRRIIQRLNQLYLVYFRAPATTFVSVGLQAVSAVNRPKMAARSLLTRSVLLSAARQTETKAAGRSPRAAAWARAQRRTGRWYAPACTEAATMTAAQSRGSGSQGPPAR